MSARATFIGFSLLALFLAVVPLTAANEYSLRLFMIFLIYAIVSVGLNVLVGLAGLVSLGQAGLFAVGSYAAAILSKRYGFDLIASCAAAILIASAFGALLAYPTVRVRGVYLTVITIAFGLIIENIAIEFPSLTGGTTGISGIPKPSALGLSLKGMRYYWVLAFVLFFTTLVVHNIKRSKYGRAMLAVSQSETAARGIGLSATAVRTFAFVISAATAGLAGALYAYLNSYISPDIFTFSDSVRFLLMVIFGGAGTSTGSLLGALILTYLPEYLQQFQYWQKFAYGLLLALVMFVLPLGVFGTCVAAVQRVRPQKRSADENSAVAVEAAIRDATAGATRGAELTATDLTVRFGGLVALNDVTLTVRPAEIHALIGPNGAGKSTFVNTITGFYRPDGGSFAIDGSILNGRPPHAIACEGFARTFQNTELFGDLSVLENVMVGYQRRLAYNAFDAAVRTPRFRAQEERCRSAAISLLAFVGLTDYANEKARFLPFGLQRWLEIARALAAAPRLLLLDEPAAGLTKQEIESLDQMIRRIASLGISILLIEHHVDLIMSVAGRVTVLDYGVVIASDVPAVIQDDPRVVEAYLGTAGSAAEQVREAS
jgi:branched-chain amino acid transport system permease protein